MHLDSFVVNTIQSEVTPNHGILYQTNQRVVNTIQSEVTPNVTLFLKGINPYKTYDFYKE